VLGRVKGPLAGGSAATPPLTRPPRSGNRPVRAMGERSLRRGLRAPDGHQPARAKKGPEPSSSQFGNSPTRIPDRQPALVARAVLPRVIRPARPSMERSVKTDPPDRRPSSSTEASAPSRHVRRGLSGFGWLARRGLPAFSWRARRAVGAFRSVTRRRWTSEPLVHAADGRSLVELFSLFSSTRSKPCCSRATSGNHPSIWTSSGHSFFRYSEGA
jgi:hypothetical protein